MDDDNGLCCFGTPLDPIEEGVVSAKRITLADQIAVDSNGRRRFHGAFTGGFSAGFWNTVGSQEGWTPSEFKSSRNEKASHRAQLPSDFMDDEDVGEYGIAPQRIQTTDDFTESNKRSKRKADNSLGPIPGVPVLELVLESCRDKAAIRLLKRMDTKYAKKLIRRTEEPKNVAVEVIDEEPNQSDNIEKNDDKESDGDQDEPQTKVYQCDLGPLQRINRCDNNSDSDSEIEFDQLISDCGEFATVLDNMKTNRFGLDYSGLEKGNFFTIMGAEAPQRASGSNALSKFTITDKNNKKVTINGQAFGVGAFEEDDDDIYDRDDMSKYDFRLENKKESGKAKQIMPSANHFIDGFIDVTKKSVRNKRVFKIHLPFKFEPRNWLIRKTRFGPQVVVPQNVVVGRHDLAPSERGNILNETDPTKSTKEQLLGLSIDERLKEARMKVVEFASSSKTILIDGEEVECEAIAATTFSQTNSENFKVPESLPLICDRFMSAGDVSESKELLPAEEIVEKPKPLKEIQKVIRTKSKWLPTQLLCYKMNIESAVGTKPDKPNAFSLFECINIPGEKRRKNEMEFTGSRHGEEKESELITNNVSRVPRIESIDAKKKQRLNDPSPAVVASKGKDQANKVQETQKPPKATIRKPLKPKTELEQKILETQDEHPSKKKDLFKAIFDSDSEDDNDNDDNGNGEKSELLQFKGQLSTMAAADAIYSSIPDDAFMPKSAKEINVLRNTSPPRGIFKSLAEIEPLRSLKKTTDTNNDTECESNANPDLYGPSLPPKDARLDIVPAIPVTISSSETSDEWIERTSTKKKKKSSKKYKTEKHKKKKSKKSKRRHS